MVNDILHYGSLAVIIFCSYVLGGYLYVILYPKLIKAFPRFYEPIVSSGNPYGDKHIGYLWWPVLLIILIIFTVFPLIASLFAKLTNK